MLTVLSMEVEQGVVSRIQPRLSPICTSSVLKIIMNLRLESNSLRAPRAQMCCAVQNSHTDMKLRLGLGWGNH